MDRTRKTNTTVQRDSTRPGELDPKTTVHPTATADRGAQPKSTLCVGQRITIGEDVGTVMPSPGWGVLVVKLDNGTVIQVDAYQYLDQIRVPDWPGQPQRGGQQGR